jgi:ABC-type uncharacterized transport system substrate-binding protein
VVLIRVKFIRVALWITVTGVSCVHQAHPGWWTQLQFVTVSIPRQQFRYYSSVLRFDAIFVAF